jgi:CHAT domain-containing protein/TPR repeat protein
MSVLRAIACTTLLLLVALHPLKGSHAQTPPSTPPESLDTSLYVDSLNAALKRFVAATPPSTQDSSAVRRWAEPLQRYTIEQTVTRTRPDEAADWLERTGAAWSALQDSSRLASALGRRGVATYVSGDTREAVDLFQRAADLHRELGNLNIAGRALNNVGVTLERLGEYKRALTTLQEAVDIFRSLEDTERVAWGLTHIGNIREEQGEYALAEACYREALAIHRDLGNAAGEAAALHNVGLAIHDQDRLDEALSYFKQALALNREQGDRESIALNLMSIGSIQRKQGRLDAARASVQEALALQREINDRARVPISLNSLGLIAVAEGRTQEALDRFRTALIRSREVGDRRNAAANLENIGLIQLDRGNPGDAVDALRESVRLVEELRVNATSPPSRRSLLSTQVEGYRALTTALLRTGQMDAALRAAERTRARMLADYLSGTERETAVRPVPPADTLQAALRPNETALLYAETTDGLTALVVSRDTIAARPLSVASRTESLSASLRSSHRSDSDRPLEASDTVAPKPLDATPDFGSLSDDVERFRRQLTDPYDRDSTVRELSRRFYSALVEPLDPLLAPTNRLVIVPSGVLGYLPFGTLRDASGRHLIEHKHLRYAPSLTVLHQLQRRSYPPRLRPLLALGGPAYGEPFPSSMSAASLIRSGGDLAPSPAPGSTRAPEFAPTDAPTDAAGTEAVASPARSYAEMGYDRWPDLPGTLREVKKLRRIAGQGSTILTGARASESILRRMNRHGDLRDYRILHFATHGVVVPNQPALSALVLSRVGTSDSVRVQDGYLTRSEIVDLDLQSDLTVLSACQTGLGQYVDGEGIVGLSGAFLRAGSNATLVSQWNVQDASTRRFMTAVYRRADRPGTTFAEAVTETKRAFLRGDYGPSARDPVHWAPFVYYGRE